MSGNGMTGMVTGTLVCLGAVLLLLSCEQIDPKSTGPSLGEDAVLLSCEGCHIGRSYLRRLAVDDDPESGGGG